MRRRPLALLLAAALPAAGLALLPAAFAATTPMTVTVPQSAGTAKATFDGTVPVGSNPTSSCDGLPPTAISANTVTLAVPAGTYDKVKATVAFAISWTSVLDDQTSDEILTVLGPDGTVVGDSDTSGSTESVTLSNPVGGQYTMQVCGFANAQPQDYTGTVIATSVATAGTPDAPPALPTVDPKGLSFGATVAADIQRSESEPNMEIDKAGNIYTCGPTGFSNADDYAQVSTDGGDQFHLLGTPPRGQQGTGGGGDCGLATSAYKNAKGNYTYSYTGLGPLTGFTTSSSDDTGKTLQNGGPQGNTDSGSGVLTDRQWQVFTDPTTVLLSYNQQQPRNVVVQKSTDGGITYGVNGVVAAPSPLFPGPMRILEAGLNPFKTGEPMVYFPWNNSDNGVNLSVSPDAGKTWTMCTVTTAKGRPAAGFMTADNDSAGNIYFSYADQTTFGTYLSTLPQSKITGCDEPVANTPATPSPQPTKNPGFSTPVQVNRGAVATTVFPWLVAGGEPGRVAIAYYGTESKGDPSAGTYKASWDVYVSQSLNALDPAGPSFAQVKATTRPMHYDSICLSGLGCSLSTPAGDRSLGDFFALDYSPTTHKLSIVYDQGAKIPDAASGNTATPAVLTQNAGPSNGGPTFDLGATPTRPALRSASVDPAGDALSSYSFLAPPGAGAIAPSPQNEPAADLLDQQIGPEYDAAGKVVPNGGFSVTFTAADLSDAALAQTMTDTNNQSLLWIFRFGQAFQAAAVSARYNQAEGFTFGFNDYGAAQCGGGNCQQYRGNKAGVNIVGTVDQKTGTIRLNVPRSQLFGLKGSTGPGQRPEKVPAVVGTRFYDATVYSVGNPLATQDSQSYLYPLDNAPSLDFLLPDPTATPAAPAAVAGLYHPLTPARVLDTRTAKAPVKAGADRPLTVTGVGGVPASGVQSIALNVTVTGGSGSGDLQVYPVGQEPATRTSNLNFVRGQSVPVLVTLGVGTGGQVAFSVNTGSVDVVADVIGYFSEAGAGAGYTALKPARVLDTRTAKAPVKAGADRSVQLAGQAGVPASGVEAVVLNATLTGPSKAVDLQVYPSGKRPAQRTSNLNAVAGQTVANAVIATLGSDGKVVLSASAGQVDVVLDVLGYYATGSGARFVPVTPTRVLDTRDSTPVAAGTDRAVPLTGVAGVPTNATAVVVSTTGVRAKQSLDLQVYPTGNAPAQRTSSLNLRPGQAVPNLVFGTLGTGGAVSLSASRSSVDVVLDVVGYLVP